MWIIDDDVFQALDPTVQSAISDKGTQITDPNVEDQIEQLAGMPPDEEGGEGDDSEKLQYGDEGQYSDKVKPDGGLSELPESDKNNIKDFDQAHDRGNSLIVAVGMKPKDKNIKPIPKKGDEEVGV